MNRRGFLKGLAAATLLWSPLATRRETLTDPALEPAQARVLKVVYTTEAAQDIRDAFGGPGDDVLVMNAVRQIRERVDQQILRDFR